MGFYCEISFDWILVDVVLVMHEVLMIANTMISKPTLPDLAFATKN